MITRVTDPKANRLRDIVTRQLFRWLHPGVTLWVLTRENSPMTMGAFMTGRLSWDCQGTFTFEQGLPERPKAPQPHNEMVYQGLRLNVHRDARGYTYPTLRKPTYTQDFTFRDMCQEAAEELLRVKDLEKGIVNFN